MKRISLTQGQVTLVDDEDYEWLSQWRWCATKIYSGVFYAVRGQWDPITKKQPVIRMHRLIMNAKKGEEVDHKDRDGLNNQKYNLRFCASGQNKQNAIGHANSSSRYKGVAFHKWSKKWQATIACNHKQVHLGYYELEEEAARVYDKKAIELFGEFARTNFPQRIARKNERNK